MVFVALCYSLLWSWYLPGRQQYVLFNETASSLMPITCGVPQGSVLVHYYFWLIMLMIWKINWNVWKSFKLALLCATAQQNYCLLAGVRHPSVAHPSVKSVFSKPSSDLMPNFVKDYLCSPAVHHISKDFFSKFLFFYDICFFFSFSLTWDHMGVKISNDISESTYQIHSKKSCHSPSGGLYQYCSKNCEISKFGFLPIFFPFSLTRDHMGVKVSNDICSESIHQICSPKFMCTPGRISTKAGKRIVKFEMLTFFSVFLWPFNMVVNGE